MNAPAMSRVALHVGEHRVDVAVPAGTTLYDALREVGVDLDAPGVSVVDSTGRALNRYGATGDDIVDGTVLHVVHRGGAAARGRSARRGRDANADVPPDPLATRPAGSAWWLGAAVAGCVVVALVVALDPAEFPSALDDVFRGVQGEVVRWSLVGVLAFAAAGLSLLRVRTDGPGSGWATVAAGLSGTAAAVCTVDPGLAEAGRFMVVAGLVGALVPVSLRWALAHRQRHPAADVAAPVAIVLAVALVVTTLTLMLGLPVALAAGVLVGGAPLGLRMVPSLSVSVPDSHLLDLSVVQRTATSVRAPEPAPPVQINDRSVGRVVSGAERRQDAGTLTLAVLPPLLVPVLLAQADPGPITRWSALATCVFVAVALALAPRTARGELLRWAPRAAAGVVLVELAVIAALGVADLPPVALVGTMLVALAAALLSVPIGRGWRSVGFSRLADTFEAMLTVLALPVGLVAGGIIEAVRILTS